MPPEIYQPITALHQQVREFVEKEHPNYKVIGVWGSTTTNYMSTLETKDEAPHLQNYIHCYTGMEFRVTAVYVGITMYIEVGVDSDGRMLIVGEQYST